MRGGKRLLLKNSLIKCGYTVSALSPSINSDWAVTKRQLYLELFVFFTLSNICVFRGFESHFDFDCSSHYLSPMCVLFILHQSFQESNVFFNCQHWSHLEPPTFGWINLNGNNETPQSATSRCRMRSVGAWIFWIDITAGRAQHFSWNSLTQTFGQWMWKRTGKSKLIKSQSNLRNDFTHNVYISNSDFCIMNAIKSEEFISTKWSGCFNLCYFLYGKLKSSPKLRNMPYS